MALVLWLKFNIMPYDWSNVLLLVAAVAIDDIFMFYTSALGFKDGKDHWLKAVSFFQGKAKR